MLEMPRVSFGIKRRWHEHFGYILHNRPSGLRAPQQRFQLAWNVRSGESGDISDGVQCRGTLSRHYVRVLDVRPVGARTRHIRGSGTERFVLGTIGDNGFQGASNDEIFQQLVIAEDKF